MDQKAIEDVGYDKGFKKGIEELAKRMKKQKIDINIIIDATGLGEKEIQNLE